MEKNDQLNHTFVSDFMVVGLSEDKDPQPLLFLVFLCIYLITVTGNILILSVISSSQRLHTPMYFFLANLSIIDIIFSSVTVPKLLFILATAQKSTSFFNCVTQLSLFQFFVVAECYLLAVMAYDRYVAICFPLNYMLIISKEVCIRMLSCSDTRLGEAVFLLVVVVAGMGPLTFILVTYGRIIAAVSKISTSKGRFKTFSTCASHFTVVALYYGSGIFSYIWPSSTYAMDKDVKVLAVLYTIMTPMLNPIIYSLRNQEVKRALKKALESKRIK
uniref:G-protein coupled receptors family 1 profile domain-containing protein n=1 Tax=Pyxicephalus adspersus TaxID=30357 RepID=A0AAV3A6F7_PYXAD|nr:TPA: hypothetical protein GDO54_017930 [Pyxicephalus adspersus]